MDSANYLGDSSRSQNPLHDIPLPPPSSQPGISILGIIKTLFGFCVQKRTGRRPVSNQHSSLNKKTSTGEEVYAKISDNITPNYTKMSRAIKRGVNKEKSQQHYSKELMNVIHDSW